MLSPTNDTNCSPFTKSSTHINGQAVPYVPASFGPNFSNWLTTVIFLGSPPKRYCSTNSLITSCLYPTIKSSTHINGQAVPYVPASFGPNFSNWLTTVIFQGSP